MKKIILDTDEITSAFLCDCCMQPAIYYSYGGLFKITTRCLNHKPSFITDMTNKEQYDNNDRKCWVSCKKGITILMATHVDKNFYKKQI
jgi:hypothetical protein